MNPQSSIAFPLGVTTYYLAKAINNNGEHARITQEHKYKRGESNILLKTQSEHSLIIYRTHGQGGPLTVHPRSIHGGGEAPGGRSSLWQGAGKRSTDAHDIGSAAAAEQRRDREKGSFLGRIPSQRIYRRRGAARGATRCLGGPMARPHPRARREGAW